jgi:hypothetical protein
VLRSKGLLRTSADPLIEQRGEPSREE